MCIYVNMYMHNMWTICYAYYTFTYWYISLHIYVFVFVCTCLEPLVNAAEVNGPCSSGSSCHFAIVESSFKISA